MGLFTNLFKSQSKKVNSIQQSYEILHTENSTFSMFSGNSYENIIFRTAVHTVAKHTAKLIPAHNIKNGEPSEELNHILQKNINPYMTTYDVIYKFITHLLINNNAYIFIQRDLQGKPVAFYPLNCTGTQFVTSDDNEIYIKFYMKNDTEYYLPYSDVIHLKTNFNSNQLTGDSNSVIHSTLQTAMIQQEGLEKSITLGTNPRGILRFNAIANKEELKKKVEMFKQDFFNISNSGGIVADDQSYTYEPLDVKSVDINADQLVYVENRIYNYFGLNKSIIESDYTEEQFSAFYDACIENIAIQLGLEFTRKIFTETEMKFGNEIVFLATRLNFSNMQTKINTLSQLQGLGLMTINESRELIGLDPLPEEEGNKRYQSLNYVDSDIAEQYQLEQMKNGNINIDNKLKSQANSQENESEETNEGN